MTQAFQLISGPLLQEQLTASDNHLGQWLRSGRSAGEIVEELYWTALSRAPSAEEREATVAWLERGDDRRAALEDVTWAVLNAKEFILRR